MRPLRSLGHLLPLPIIPVLLISGAALAQTPAKQNLTAREIRYDVVCPLPRDIPCSINKPVLAGYQVLTEKVSLDDQGAYWIADLSKARQQRGQNEPLRVLSDNGILHLINVKYPASSTPAAKPRKVEPGKTPPEKKVPAATTKTITPAKADKSSPKVEACYERCRTGTE